MKSIFRLLHLCKIVYITQDASVAQGKKQHTRMTRNTPSVFLQKMAKKYLRNPNPEIEKNGGNTAEEPAPIKSNSNMPSVHIISFVI